MRSAAAGLLAHLALPATTLAWLWRVERTDGQVLCFTDHDRPILHERRVYQASSGFWASAVAANAALEVDNLDVDGVLDSAAITEADLLAGLYDYAEVFIEVLNWAAPSAGSMIMHRGRLGQVSVTGARFRAELRGLSQAFSQTIVEVTSPGCRARLGDARCGVDVAALTVTGTITNVTGRRILGDTARAEATNFWRGGKLTMTSGQCNGLAMEVKSFAVETGVGVLRLMLPYPFDVQVGDTYSLEPGCDFSIQTCVDRYDNGNNFRGESHLPGMRKVTAFKVPPG